MISIKDLAIELGITTQAIYKYFRNYPELSEHKDKGFLDDYAAEFIRSKSNPNPVVVVNQENLAKIEYYRQKYEEQLVKNQEIIDMLLEAQNLASERLLELKDKDYLEKENEALKSVVNDYEKENKSLKEDIDSIKSMSLFQRIRGFKKINS